MLFRKLRLTFYAVEIGDTEDQYAYADESWILRLLDQLLHFGILWPLAVVGVVATWSERRRLLVPYLLFLSYTATTLLFYVFSRYRFPLVPLSVPFAAAGLITLIDLIVARAWRRLAPWLAVALITAAIVNQRIVPWMPNRFAAVSYFNLSAALAERGDRAGAAQAASRGFERDEEMLLEFAATLSEDSAFELGAALLALGKSYATQGRATDALAAVRQGLSHARPETETERRLRALEAALSSDSSPR